MILEKTCLHCRRPFQRNENESLQVFRRRTHCCWACYCEHEKQKGIQQKLAKPVRIKYCTVCGAPFHPREKESNPEFDRRKTCGRSFCRHHSIVQTKEEKAYLPTQEEIRAECARIQAGWSDTEREHRKAIKPVPWEFPRVEVMYG